MCIRLWFGRHVYFLSRKEKYSREKEEYLLYFFKRLLKNKKTLYTCDKKIKSFIDIKILKWIRLIEKEKERWKSITRAKNKKKDYDM